MRDKIANKLFQNLWFFCFKGLVRRKHGSGINLADYHRRMVWQIRIARFVSGIFGTNIKLFIFGDSDKEVFSTFRFMKSWGVVAINIAIGGTEAWQWWRFFTDPGPGQQIYEMLLELERGGARCLADGGGNDVIRRKLAQAKQGVVGIRKLFPNAFYETTPPVHLSAFEQLGYPKDVLGKDIQELNKTIKESFGIRTIDLWTPFVSLSGEAYDMVLRDVVHWSDFACRVILNEEKRILGLTK